ncbi:MAG: nicotinate-nucleotide adenylyltransferase [Desulfomonile tiedjei]|nr:nicotinate-nucleotide adenylyltransferase [Desulfomonile tiedjei]
MRLGIFGGTFNPPHVGHLRLAEEVAPLFGLTRILFIPCHLPPHKSVRYIAPPEDRLEMTHRACADNPLFEVSDMEIAARGPSYTVRTLEAFAARRDEELFFILGTDSLREIHTWKDHERLFSLANFVVVTRPGVDFRSAWAELPASLRAQFHESGDEMIHGTSTRLMPAPVEGLKVSSTLIRTLIREGKSIRYLVTESVRSYIMDRKLYRQ